MRRFHQGHFAMPLHRRVFLLSGAASALPFIAKAQGEAVGAVLAAGSVLMGVERVAKLQMESGLLPQRAAREFPKARRWVGEAIRQLKEPSKLTVSLTLRRQNQLLSVADDAFEFVNAPPAVAAELISDSEALAVRLGFVTTTLAGLNADPIRGAHIDMFMRAGASALRLGKLNFAATAAPKQMGLQVAARQALVEFNSALAAVSLQSLGGAQRNDLQLIQNQWLLFRAALRDDGLVKDPSRLADVASTTDRIAESLVGMARFSLLG